MLDLSAYLDRIGWSGETAPTYATLAGILAAHTGRVPFENFDVLLGRPIRLDIDSLQSKLVAARRGGYCFEHASLMAAALEQIGFRVTRHAARVVLFQPLPKVPRDHMFLTVETERGAMVVDPGFGPFGSRIPVPMDGSVTPAGQFMSQDGPRWILNGSRRGEPFTGWVSDMGEENEADFEMANHFKSTHPGSPFRQWIFASAVTPTGRVNILNRDVTEVTADGETAAQLSDRRALRALLAAAFGFDLAEAEALKVPAVPEWH